MLPINEETIVTLCVDKLSAFLGLKIILLHGGPNLSDPAGKIAYYLGFRDKSGKGMHIGIDGAGNLAEADWDARLTPADAQLTPAGARKKV